MYKINELKKLKEFTTGKNEKSGKYNLELKIDESLRNAKIRGINKTSIFFFNLSMIGVNVDSDYFKDYLQKLRDEGYKVEIVHSDYFSEDDNRKLIISYD